MNHHACKPPTGERPLDDPPTWECPECRDVWERRPKQPQNPALTYDFATGKHLTQAKWIRIGPSDRSGEEAVS
jgi:hypothetical protein